MALQSSGAISLLDIANEFGGTAPHAINEYYGAASGIPTSGTIALSNFYGASAISWDLSVISYTNKVFNTGSNRFGLDFKPDSSQMFLSNSVTIQTYTLSTPGDVTTATLTATGSSIISALPDPQPQEAAGYGGPSYSIRGFKFNPTGTILTVWSGERTLYQFTLSTPWNTSSSSISYLNWHWIGGLGSYAENLAFDDNGTISWIPVFPNSSYTWYRGYGSNYTIYGVIPKNVSLTNLYYARNPVFKTDGTKVFMISRETAGATWTLITEHSLSTPFDMETITSTPTASYDTAVNPVFAAHVNGFWINPGGKALYINDYSTSKVHQFSL